MFPRSGVISNTTKTQADGFVEISAFVLRIISRSRLCVAGLLKLYNQTVPLVLPLKCNPRDTVEHYALRKQVCFVIGRLYLASGRTGAKLAISHYSRLIHTGNVFYVFRLLDLWLLVLLVFDKFC